MASLAECRREAQAQGELPAGKDPGHVAVALIDAFEGAVTRAKVERNRSPFDSFEAFVFPALVTKQFRRINIRPVIHMTGFSLERCDSE